MAKAKTRKPPKEGICEFCKSTEKVEFRVNPKSAELEGNMEEHWSCDPCFYTLREEI